MKKALSLKGGNTKTWLTIGGILVAGAIGYHLLSNGGLNGLFNPSARAMYTMGYPGGAAASPVFQHRSFNDYTYNANGLPTPWVEVNVPYDNTVTGAKLSNVIDKGAYIQTYDGVGAFGHIGL